jgi:hypothetical protein
MRYLENNICEFEPLFNIEFNKKKNLYVTSLFKMFGTGGYKKFFLYINGLTLLNNYSRKVNMYVRLFIDNTIYEDKEIMNALKKLDRVEMVLYKCNKFMIDKHHVGLFGTMVRYFPAFDFPNNDANICHFVDADTKQIDIDEDFQYMLKISNIIKKRNIDMDMGYKANYYHPGLKNVTSKYKNNKRVFLPYIVGMRLISFKRINREVIENYLKQVELYMDEKTRPTKILSPYHIKKEYISKKCENNICYGVDEYFLNENLVTYLLEKDLKFCFYAVAGYDSLYYFFSPFKCKYFETKEEKDNYYYSYNRYMKALKLENKTPEQIDKMLFIADKKHIDKNMMNFVLRIRKLIKYLLRKKDFSFYSEFTLSSFKTLNLKKYYNYHFIRFINYDYPDIIVKKVLLN